MLSLLNGSALGFDLVRLQNGPLVADMVLAALAIQPEDLTHVPAGDRAHVAPPHLAVPRSDLPNGTSVLPPGELTLRDVPARASQPDTSLTALTSLLTSATIGSLEALVSMLRREVFAWTWQRQADGETLASRTPEAGRLQTTCLAAVSAAYGAVDLDEPRIAEALTRWHRLHAGLPRRSVPLGPQQMQLAVLLARIQSLQPHEVKQILDAYHRHQPTQLWAPAVHEATWAAYLSGRVAAAAAAQLHLVAAVRAAEVSLDDIAAGFWNAVSGAVSALVVQDLLDDVSCDLLLARYPVLARPQL
ncbi:MAG TPA: hypothetical protein VFL94_03045 [Actinomycetales bacterium]|nr:hypothetical protein [Actinomycetales bacterium]